ncbi:hypothetical protein PVAND_017788 [Polypedilum vanderplanki]|uniref:Uncharacterized protein n=1 Tax=Polypedilum vanderplanki TaxID=319348 RepID=A0A9J6B9R5_POLVA|nr:hypothetical protein PVAND_017788 [Polypedilum vanderplanki]
MHFLELLSGINKIERGHTISLYSVARFVCRALQLHFFNFLSKFVDAGVWMKMLTTCYSLQCSIGRSGTFVSLIVV